MKLDKLRKDRLLVLENILTKRAEGCFSDDLANDCPGDDTRTPDDCPCLSLATRLDEADAPTIASAYLAIFEREVTIGKTVQVRETKAADAAAEIAAKIAAVGAV